MSERIRDVARAEIVHGVQSTPVATIEPALVATAEPIPVPTPEPPAVATLPPLRDPPTGGIAIAS